MFELFKFYFSCSAEIQNRAKIILGSGYNIDYIKKLFIT